jgi:hypothetical protein
MALRDILYEAKSLSLAERRELIKLLVDTLTTDEPAQPPVEDLLSSERAHEVWSPYDSFKAAQQLQVILDEYKHDHA